MDPLVKYINLLHPWAAPTHCIPRTTMPLFWQLLAAAVDQKQKGKSMYEWPDILNFHPSHLVVLPGPQLVEEEVGGDGEAVQGARGQQLVVLQHTKGR